MNLPDLADDTILAEALGCDPGTVQARALAGELPGVKYGRGWVFPREAVLEALNRQAREAAAIRQAGKAPAAPAAVAMPQSTSASGRRRPLPALPTLPGQ